MTVLIFKWREGFYPQRLPSNLVTLPKKTLGERPVHGDGDPDGGYKRA
jgi:hypothetical protein